VTIQKLKIKIIALGKIKEKYLQSGIDEFLKRLTPYASVSVVEISPLQVKDENLLDKVLNDEGEKILANIKPLDYVITMEIKGKEFSSEEFAQKIQHLTNEGVQEIVFVIGSSCGIGKNVSERANLKMSMSKMTFLHEFARLILVEQIYRAFKIIKGETYHK
jgi:23S rRNA (pseudouridine1915-N3)-methyltransferase